MERGALDALIAQGESTRLEFKVRTSQGCLRTATNTLCAMANGDGGRVLFGVTDDGTIAGQTVADSTLQTVWAAIREIAPGITPDVTVVRVSDKAAVVAVSVGRGVHRPYRVRGTAYKRVAASTAEMTEVEAQRLTIEAAHGTTRWETEPLERLTLEALDPSEILATAREGFSRGRVPDPGSGDPLTLLRGMGLVRDGQPVRAAAVLFGRPEFLQGRLPQCRVRLARFRGLDKTEFVDQRQEVGNAFELLRSADQFLRRNLPVAGRIVGGVFERQDDPVYPPEALREALANALCHRDYSQAGGSVGIAIFDDRLEITSPGGLHFGLTVADLYREHDSMPWNRLIADVFYRRGIIESWGRGTLRMAQLSEQAGLPRPEFEEPTGTLLVRFRPNVYVPPERIRRTLTERQRHILTVIASRSGNASLSDIVEALGPGTSRRNVQTDLQFLRGLELIASSGHGRGAHWILTARRDT